MKVLVIAEHDNQSLRETTRRVITAAKELKAPITVLIAGYNCQSVAQEVQKLPVQEILVADQAAYAHQLPENLSALIQSIGKEYGYILAPANTFGKNLLPRVAALLDVQAISDVLVFKSADTFQRPIYAGNALMTLKSKDPIKVLTIRTTAFAPVEKAENSSVPIANLTQVIENPSVEFLGQETTTADRLDLGTARIIVSGGRGLKSSENFKLLEDLAQRLHAGIGASRAAVDAGFVPNDYQIGQTGKIVAPELYIAVGISGAIQHLAGMKDSKIIVAINKDADAPIFKVADYGLVGDLFQIIPELIAALGPSR